jgi:hypothetical protein
MMTRDELVQRGEAVRQQLQHGAYGSTGTAVNASVPGVSRLTKEAVLAPCGVVRAWICARA